MKNAIMQNWASRQKKLSRAGILSQTEGGWPFAIPIFFFTIYNLTKFVLDLPNIITANKKIAHTKYFFSNSWPVSPFSRISWHRPTMGSAVASCCSFSKTGMEENKKNNCWGGAIIGYAISFILTI